jgi:hypothetical protein
MSSTLSKDLKNMLEDFNRGPIIGKRKKVKEEEEFMEYDVSRAYTKCLTQITHIPKFTYFDHLTPMKTIENHESYCSHNRDTINVDKLLMNIPDQTNEDIDEHSFYLIYSLKLDDVLFPQRKDFVTGEVLIHARKYKIPFIMLAKISPCMIQ